MENKDILRMRRNLNCGLFESTHAQRRSSLSFGCRMLRNLVLWGRQWNNLGRTNLGLRPGFWLCALPQLTSPSSNAASLKYRYCFRFIGLWIGWNGTMHVKHLAECLAYRMYSVNVNYYYYICARLFDILRMHPSSSQVGVPFLSVGFAPHPFSCFYPGWIQGQVLHYLEVLSPSLKHWLFIPFTSPLTQIALYLHYPCIWRVSP